MYTYIYIYIYIYTLSLSLSFSLFLFLSLSLSLSFSQTLTTIKRFLLTSSVSSSSFPTSIFSHLSSTMPGVWEGV